MTRRSNHSLATMAVIALVAIGCTSTSPIPSPSAGASSAPEPTGSAGDSPAATSGETALIPQPEPPDGLEVAPDDERVDLAVPTFSNPTDITNPLFPVSSQHSVLLTGTVEDQAFRTEVTLLPYTRILQWEGQEVEVLVSQYVAFLDGRIEEVAYDLYAQADDGSVWYFGEDVFNFADGAIADTHGTWIAGIDGPAAMIMPADPQVGDVYRPENIPGLVFEEVTVVSTDETLDGPFGPIEGGLLVRELHMDGETEDKQFAPGYGEFYTAAGGDVEALTMAVPADAADGAEPEQLAALIDEPHALIAALAESDAGGAEQALDAIAVAHEAYPADEIPALLGPLLDESVERLSTAVADGDDAAASQAAIDVGRLGLDLGLRYRDQAGIEIRRFDLWLAQAQLDAAAEDAARLNADYFALDYVRERFVSDIGADQSAALNLGMEELLGAIGDEDFEGVAEIVGEMRAAAAELSPAD
jgi:hypothetical protein